MMKRALVLTPRARSLILGCRRLFEGGGSQYNNMLICLPLQVYDRIVAIAATRPSRSAALWNHTVVKFTALNSASPTKSGARKHTCARSAATRRLSPRTTTFICAAITLRAPPWRGHTTSACSNFTPPKLPCRFRHPRANVFVRWAHSQQIPTPVLSSSSYVARYSNVFQTIAACV